MRSRTGPRPNPGAARSSAEETAPDDGEPAAGATRSTRRAPADGPVLVPALERATYRAEAPLRGLVRSNRLNPLPHAGTISVFLLGVVVVTGVYITLFFQFGFAASHRSVEKMADHPIQSVVRTVHRYASAALVLTTVVHAWRVFVAGRFRGPRRWRWTSGVAALLVVWLAGVTGYWLVWDERAQALNEATTSVAGGLDAVATFFVRDVYGPGADTGWPVLFVIWLAHLLLTAVVGFALWRHVRRTRMPVLPPRLWMAVMFGALLVVSIAMPADLLERADPSQVVGDLPLDPFVLFLLPPLLSGWAWLAVVVLLAASAAVLAAPHVMRRPTPVVEIDVEACTGCDLCVADCPFEALSMHDRADADPVDGTRARRPIAVVDAARCVGCGICIGSCSFGAMTLPGFDAIAPADRVQPAGKHVMIACERHRRVAPDAVIDSDGDVVVVDVPCSGMLHAQVIGSLVQAGATQVQVVGCAPGECAYGTGNRVMAQRLTGERAPHLQQRWAGSTAADWVAPGQLAAAVADPNRHPDADPAHVVRGRRLVAAGAVVLLSVVAVAFATRAPYTGHAADSGVLVIVDHVPGRTLEGQTVASGAPGADVDVVVRVDGDEVRTERVPVRGGAAVGVVDVPLSPADVPVDVSLVMGDATTVLYSGTASLSAGQRLVVAAVDQPPPPGLAEGRAVFEDRGLGACDVCHSTAAGRDGVGPSLSGVAERAATRVPGLSPEEYLRQSIMDPDAYVVDGYPAGQMLPMYAERLTSAQIDALVQYLMSLHTEAGTGGAP